MSSVDLLQFHDVDRNVPIEESWGALQELVAEGKVRYGGLSNHPPELVERALAVGPVAALQFQYSALARTHEEDLLPYAQRPGPRRHRLGAARERVPHRRLLARRSRRETTSGARTPSPSWTSTETHEELRARGGGSVTRGALDFVLAHPAVTGAIVGIRNEREGRELAAAL